MDSRELTDPRSFHTGVVQKNEVQNRIASLVQLTGYFVGASLWAFKTKPSFIFTIPGIAMVQKWSLEMTTPSTALGRSSWGDLLWSFVPGCLRLLLELSL